MSPHNPSPKKKSPPYIPADAVGLLAFLHWNHAWNGFQFPVKTLRKAVQQIADLGVSTVRIDILWQDVAAGRGFRFDRYEPIVALLSRHKIGMLAVLQYNKTRKDKSGRETWNTPPDSDAAFARYAAATVRHFRSEIRFWEVWNEPNHPVYWTGPGATLERYVRLLKAAYAGIKAADPGAVVLNGGLTEPVVKDMKRFYALGGGACSDILNIHLFVDPHAKDPLGTMKTVITQVRRVMIRHGDGAKKIWLTEAGCPGVPKEEGPKTWFAGGMVTEKEQAAWLRKLFTGMRRHPSVEKVFWAFYRDTGNAFKDGTDHLGLVRFDWTPKPAFLALQKMIR